MTRKTYLSAIILLAAAVFFSACIVEYDFDRAPPWTGGTANQPVSANDIVGEARGWQNGRLTVTLNLVNGNIENVRIYGQRETPSHTRDLIQLAQRNAALFNSFDFLDGMTGATVTRNAIRDAGRDALMNAGVDL